MFVVLEGGEGAGKTTLAQALRQRLEDEGYFVTLTREPGGTAVGEEVRQLLHLELTPWAETFAFLTARAQLVAEVIRPALADGQVVICDRFAASTFAYQGFARGLDIWQLRAANAIATGNLEPDLTLYLDLPPEVGLVRKRGEEEAIRTGLEGLEFHQLVRAGYLELASQAAPGEWATLDATQPPEQVAEQAWAALAARIAARPVREE